MDDTKTQPNAATVLVVGSGITGLMTAYRMAVAGYSVKVVSKSPDPREAHQGTRYDSSTWDGYVNRYITLTEGHPYLDLPGYISVMYPDIGQDFRTEIAQGGMLAMPMREWGALTQAFLHERLRANEDQAATLQLFQTYVDENRASMELWYELLTEAVLHYPELAEALSLHTHGIDRFYDEAHLYEGAARSQQAEQIVKQRYSVEQLLCHPDFQLYREGIAQHGFIRGGAITMYGLAFDVQALGRAWLLRELDQRGVELCFGPEYEVLGMERDAAGAVMGVRTLNGALHSARHICFHSGAYSKPEVFKGTAAYGKLAGVKGLWMRIKHAQQLFGAAEHAPRPNKIHGGKYAVEIGGQTYQGQVADLNIMPKFNSDGSWELVIGSGYLFVGIYPFEADLELGEPQPIAALEQQRRARVQLAEELALRAFVQVVERMYNLEIDLEAVRAGTHPQIDLPSRGCVRSWTPDDNELRVILPTAQGGILLIDGGGNTGSTTKAPFNSEVARQFVQSLDAATGPLPPLATLEASYAAMRGSLRRTREQLPAERWQELEDTLNASIELASAVLSA